MTRRSPWCSQHELASLSEQDFAFHVKATDDPGHNETMSFGSPLLHHRSAITHATSNLRRRSSSQLMAHPLQYTMVTSGVREPSTHWKKAKASTSSVWPVLQENLCDLLLELGVPVSRWVFSVPDFLQKV